MIVELIGCTGVGKTTVANRLLERLMERRRPVLSSEEFVLRCYGLRLGWLRWRPARSLLVDLLTFPWFVLFAARHARLCQFMAGVAWRDIELPLFRLNVLRNIAKQMGIHELLCRRASPGEVVILDEGMVHQAHSIFIHPTHGPRPLELARFLAEVPMPDVLVLVDGPTAEVVRRTVERGHPRLPGSRIVLAEQLVGRAQNVFRHVTEQVNGQTTTAVMWNDASDREAFDAALGELCARVDGGALVVSGSAQCWP
jgi:hypothetical protein